LQDNTNKEELYALLSEVASHVYPPEKWVYITTGEREREFCPINLDVLWTRVTMRRQTA